MSSFDQSFLDTGVSSAASRKVAAKRAKDAADALKDKSLLEPVGDQLVALCDKELADIYDMRKVFVTVSTSEADIKAERIARALHDQFVQRFKASVQKVLKAKDELS